MSSLEILGDFIGSIELVYITKPILMPLLIALYLPIWKKQKDLLSKLLISALFFAFIGDVALMFLSINEQFFLLGLGAFMVTQLLYIIIFSKTGFQIKKLLKLKSLFVLILFIVVYVALMYVLYDKLHNMLIPVLVYGAVVCLMGFLATMRIVNHLSYLLVLIGACFFICSDALIAINKFIFSADLIFIQPMIMILYVVAQYFIVVGLIKSYNQ